MKDIHLQDKLTVNPGRGLHTKGRKTSYSRLPWDKFDSSKIKYMKNSVEHYTSHHHPERTNQREIDEHYRQNGDKSKYHLPKQRLENEEWRRGEKSLYSNWAKRKREGNRKS